MPITANEHISAETIERYRSQNASPTETLAVQIHIADCEMCRANLARTIAAEKSFASIKNNFAFDDIEQEEPEHLPYERLALFIDGKLDEVDAEIVESHLFVCAECSKDIADLRSYQTIAAAAAATIPATVANEPAEKKSFWRRLFAFDSFGGSFAPVAAVFLVAVLLGAWFLARFNNTQEIVQSNTNQNTITGTPLPPSPNPSLNPSNNNANPAANINSATNEAGDQNSAPPSSINQTAPLLALNDGQISVDENGNVKGLENLSPAAQKAVRQSLQTGKVTVGADSLGGANGVLMSGGGGEASGVPFALQTPVGKIVRENQPVLRWKPLKDAINYSVAIVDDKFRIIEESGKLNSTSWKPSKPLPRGAIYSWQVTATKPDGTETVSPPSPAPQAKFKIIDQAALNEISKLENSPVKSRLALGILYAQAGLKTEARREFEILVKQNPRSQIVRQLLAGVK